MTDAQRRAAVAERAARAGGAVARDAFREEIDVETKVDAIDLVTEADRDAQRQVVTTVTEEFPNDVVCGEEDAIPPAGPDDPDPPSIADSLPDTGDAWVVDPIDGTTNFVGGLRVWTTSVAAVVDGEPVGSATYMPAEGEIFTAGPDGASRDGEPLRVSERSDTDAFVVGVVGRWEAAASERLGAFCSAVATEAGDLRRFGSMQASLAFVASGGLDATVMHFEPSHWDSVAGVHLVREAGGVVTDLDGEPWDLHSDSLVASNGEAHDAALRIANAGRNR